jgi:hypothetical protein
MSLGAPFTMIRPRTAKIGSDANLRHRQRSTERKTLAVLGLAAFRSYPQCSSGDLY